MRTMLRTRIMHRRTLLIALASLLLVQACGGEEPAVDLIECGEGTVEEDGVCVAEEVECAADELQLDDGTCVRVDYCGEGTTFQESTGTCVAPPLICGPGTEANEEDLCEAGPQAECGEGTVVADEQCVPWEDVCGENTAPDIQQGCLPRPDVCGEGTTFDVNNLVCVPLSNLSCGPGTIDLEGVCTSLSAFYEDLAQEADLDLNTAGETHVELKDLGERFVILGTIDSPDTDRLTFDVEAGQWLRVSIFSFGLPDPGVQVSDDESFYRYTDLAATGEVWRHVVAPAEGTMSMTLGSLPQLLGELEPDGGEDWEYVATVEVMEAPEAEIVDVDDASFSGNLRDLPGGFFAVEGAQGSTMALLFSTLPTNAMGQVLVFDEDMIATSVTDIEAAISVELPSETSYLLFDRVYAYGVITSYTASGQLGSSLAAGDVATVEVELAAGEYVGLFQYNLDEAPLPARILDGGQEVASADPLAVSTAAFGQTSLYAYAFDSTTVTLEVENDTGEDLGFFALSHVVGVSEAVDEIDGDEQSFSSSVSLTSGQRHYVQLDVDFTGLLRITSAQQVALELLDSSGSQLSSGMQALVADLSAGAYVLAIEALSALPSGFSLTFEESQIFSVSETSAPSLAIPDNSPAGVDDVITVGSCPLIGDIDMDIEITHTWRGDLRIELTSPGGITHTLKDRYGGSTNDIIGNFNQTLEPNVGFSGDNAVAIDSFVGESGTGEWTLNVSDNVSGDTGTLNEWTLNLECE